MNVSSAGDEESERKSFSFPYRVSARMKERERETSLEIYRSIDRKQ
jgi:hypothetical protein